VRLPGLQSFELLCTLNSKQPDRLFANLAAAFLKWLLLKSTAPVVSGSVRCSVRLRWGLNTLPPSSSPKWGIGPALASPDRTSSIFSIVLSNAAGTEMPLAWASVRACKKKSSA